MIKSFFWNIRGEGEQHISFTVHHNFYAAPFTASFVHALCTVEERQGLWSGLLQDKPLVGPWLVCGDFNAVVDTGEKKVGSPFVCLRQLIFYVFC